MIAIFVTLDNSLVTKETQEVPVFFEHKPISSFWQFTDIVAGAWPTCCCQDLQKGYVMRHRWWLTAAAVLPFAVSFAGFGPAAQASGTARASSAATSTGPGIGGGRTGLALGVPFCQNLGKGYQASAAAQMYCFGAQHVGRVQPAAINGAESAGNVDAANFREDVSPAGVRGYGQSETSIAASGRFVVEAWNDSTTFFTLCGARQFKEEGTGLGFSANGGQSFTDLGGLPNPDCKKFFYAGDPSVVAYQAGGHTYFYISSLYLPANGVGPTHIAFDACAVVGSTLHCGSPVIAASSKQCLVVPHQGTFCSFLDKDFMSIDPARGRLYVSYSDFPVVGNGGNPIDLSACDLGTRSGGAGPAGGTPAHPVCETGTKLVQQPGFHGHLFAGKPYFMVAGPDKNGCENEGAYPAVDVKQGGVYVGYEFNWATNFFSFQCLGGGTKTAVNITGTPFHCLTLTKVASCAHPSARNFVDITSMDAAFIPGYNRFPMNDFPRLAVSPQFGTVSMVWNDSRFHPNGDILLQSFNLGTLKRVQRSPVVLDQPHGGGVTMLPGLRLADQSGRLDVAWYSRASTGTANTDVTMAVGVSPRGTATPRNVTVTNKASDWLVNNSDIVPNFGDYLDVVVSATGEFPFVGNTVYIAWSDGRSGVPQPFAASMPTS